jgi:hypothetical protein
MLLVFVYFIATNQAWHLLIPVPFAPSAMKQQRSTRSTANYADHKVEIPRSKTDCHQNSFIPYIFRLWNKLPFNVVGD